MYIYIYKIYNNCLCRSAVEGVGYTTCNSMRVKSRPTNNMIINIILKS